MKKTFSHFEYRHPLFTLVEHHRATNKPSCSNACGFSGDEKLICQSWEENPDIPNIQQHYHNAEWLIRLVRLECSAIQLIPSDVILPDTHNSYFPLCFTEHVLALIPDTCLPISCSQACVHNSTQFQKSCEPSGLCAQLYKLWVMGEVEVGRETHKTKITVYYTLLTDTHSSEIHTACYIHCTSQIHALVYIQFFCHMLKHFNSIFGHSKLQYMLLRVGSQKM